jgi:hypothetical protein
MKHFTSDQFNWKNGHGIADMTDLFGRYENVSRFTIKSTRTGVVRTYEIDTNAPGYEDGWDGEYVLYTDNLFDGTRVTIINN